MTSSRGPVLNIDEAEVHDVPGDDHWGGSYRVLTPFMTDKGGALCMNVSYLPPGHVGCPFHYHMLDDELFHVVSGTGVLRYGDDIIPIRAGDTISCPAGSKIAHQIANTGEVDLVYLGIGANSPNEVCVYPDSGKVMVRALKSVGVLNKADYMEGEPAPPRVLEMARTSTAKE